MPDELTDDQVAEWKRKIDAMSREAMCQLWRFAPAGHPVFRSDLPLFGYFDARFDKLGRFSPAISKRIGLGL